MLTNSLRRATSRNPVVRQRIEEKFSRLGMNMRLEDCSVPVYFPSGVEEVALVETESASIAALRSNLNLRPSVPAARIDAARSELSPYWERIFEEFSE